MFGSVALSTHSMNDYTLIVGAEAIDDLRRLAEPLRGMQLLALASPGASGAAAKARVGAHHIAGYLKLFQQVSCKRRPSPTTPARNRES
jgi:hypothetical protein